MKPLLHFTDLQRAFIREYLADEGQAHGRIGRAALAAGYAHPRDGARLFQRADVQEIIADLEGRTLVNFHLSLDCIINQLWIEATGSDDPKAASARVNALKTIAVLKGYEPARRTVHEHREYEGTDDDVVREIKRLNKQLGVAEDAPKH